MRTHTAIALLRWIFVSLGAILLAMIVLAFTPAPFYMHRWLGEDKAWNEDANSSFEPDYIVMYGGAGMPSESNLIRLYYTATLAQEMHCPVVLVHPKDSLCQAEMARYLTNSGVEADSIFFMTCGSNTRLQTLCLADSFPQLTSERLLVVTAPEHLTRTLKCMRKCGFMNLRGIGAFENTVDFDLALDKNRMQGNRFVPDVENTNMRYTFWNYLKLEISCIREYVALGYYWVKNWV